MPNLFAWSHRRRAFVRILSRLNSRCSVLARNVTVEQSHAHGASGNGDRILVGETIALNVTGNVKTGNHVPILIERMTVLVALPF